MTIKEFEITSLKLTTSAIREVKPAELVEAELWLTFKIKFTEDFPFEDIFMNATKEVVKQYCWDNEADYPKYKKAVKKYVDNIPYLTYKPKLNTFVYHKFFTWNLITQATIHELKLLSAGINSHRYDIRHSLLACLQTLNAWDT